MSTGTLSMEPRSRAPSATAPSACSAPPDPAASIRSRSRIGSRTCTASVSCCDHGRVVIIVANEAHPESPRLGIAALLEPVGADVLVEDRHFGCGIAVLTLIAFLSAVVQHRRPQYFSAGPTHWIMTIERRSAIGPLYRRHEPRIAAALRSADRSHTHIRRRDIPCRRWRRW